LARLFLRLGTIGFGGPAGHIALFEHEVVRRRAWMDRTTFLDYLSAANLIPGPNSTELAIHIGRDRAGLAGLMVAGACFILPASLIVGIIAWAYVRYGSVPEFQRLLYGVGPVVIAVVVHALLGLGRTAVRTAGLAVVAVGCLAVLAAGAHELIVLPAAGLAAVLVSRAARARAAVWLAMAGGSVLTASATGVASQVVSTAVPFGLAPLFFVFLKIGSVLFGSGYVLLAFLRADLVERFGWLTERQLLDATAIGLVTPGPVFTTATFIGYVLGGVAGAITATVGIFLPAFVFVALSGPIVPRLRQSAVAGAALDGVNVASLALMLVVALRLGASALVDGVTWTVALVSLALLISAKMSPTRLILIGAAAGLLARS
jgi:chromate transporter